MKFKGFRESLASTMRNFNLFDVRDMYENLSKKEIPMLALWGKKDGIVPFSGSEEYQRIFDNGKLVVLEEGTHDITYRQPTIVGTEIIDFIDQL